MVERRETTSQLLQARFQKFSRVEKAFYISIAITAIVLALSVVYMQTKLLQVQNDLTIVNTKIEEKKTELDDAKQEVNELVRSDRLAGIANSQELQLNNENIRSEE